jgi:glycosyltransferase involved in cell wall biosynthesis
MTIETKTIVMTSTFYPPFHIGGDAVHVKYLAEDLVTKGHEVHVVYSVDAYRLKRGGDLPRGNETGVHVHPVESGLGRISPALTYFTGSNKKAERLLENLIRNEKPDFVHHHNISLLGGRMLGIGGLPKIYTAHDYWLLCQRNDFMRNGKILCRDRRCFGCSLRSIKPYQFWRGQKFKRTVGDIDRIIAPSEFMSSIIKSYLHMTPLVIPNFAPRIPVPLERRNESPYFLFASALERSKGLHLLLDAYVNADLDSDLHIAGKGSLESLVRDFERRTEGRVKYLGFLNRSDLMSEMSSSLCLVSPSICNENSPLSCIEALSLGKLLVVSSSGGLPELVNNPQCGIVSESSAGGIARALRRIEEDEGLRLAFSKNALHRYETHHTPERYTDAYLKAAEEALASAS